MLTQYQLVLVVLTLTDYDPLRPYAPLFIYLFIFIFKKENIVLNVHRNYQAYSVGGEGEGEYIRVATLSPPEGLLH